MPEQSIRYRLNNKKNIHYQLGGIQDIEKILNEDCEYNIIIANNVTDRVENLSEFLNKISKSLSKGGEALLTVNISNNSTSNMDAIPKKYGQDYIGIISRNNMVAKIIWSDELLPPTLCHIFGIGCSDYIIVSKKDE